MATDGCQAACVPALADLPGVKALADLGPSVEALADLEPGVKRLGPGVEALADFEPGVEALADLEPGVDALVAFSGHDVALRRFHVLVPTVSA